MTTYSPLLPLGAPGAGVAGVARVADVKLRMPSPGSVVVSFNVELGGVRVADLENVIREVVEASFRIEPSDQRLRERLMLIDGSNVGDVNLSSKVFGGEVDILPRVTG
jgi:hypothetical protein